MLRRFVVLLVSVQSISLLRLSPLSTSSFLERVRVPLSLRTLTSRNGLGPPHVPHQVNRTLVNAALLGQVYRQLQHLSPLITYPWMKNPTDAHESIAPLLALSNNESKQMSNTLWNLLSIARFFLCKYFCSLNC